MAIWIVMMEKPSSFNLMGPVCGPWGLPNRGTSRRDWVNWRGNEQLPYIRRANQMVSRMLIGTREALPGAA